MAEATDYINEARKHFELLNKIRPGVSRSLLCEDSYKNVRAPCYPIINHSLRSSTGGQIES